MKLSKKQMNDLSHQVQVVALDPSAYGSRKFRVQLTKPIERRIFEDAMVTEFGFQLKNKPSEKVQTLFLDFDWRKMPPQIWGRVVDRLVKIGHLEVK